jgi:Xaa-Pro dipeptidase
MSRFDRLISEMRRQKTDAVILVPGTNLRWLTGMPFHAGERLTAAVITAAGDAGFVLPAMEAQRVKGASPVPFRLYPWDDNQPAAAAMGGCAADLSLAGKAIAVEHLAMRVFELRAIEAAAPRAVFVDAQQLFAPLRVVKDQQEISLMRAAAEMIDASLEKLLPQIRPGLSEREIASRWVIEILRTGAESPAFECIIASGPNAAFPHHGTGDRELQVGDLLVLDGGARHGGYASDITRTVMIGEPTEQQKRIYEVVKAANEAGRRAGRPGVSGRAVDAAARKVIEDAGFGEHFMHRTGHGLGMDVHEEPYIAPANDQPLPVGCVFTIEPGVYVNGVGGVRIEDDVTLTEGGAESLTRSGRDLIIL